MEYKRRIMTVILEQYPVAEVGTFEIHRMVTITVSSEEARRTVNRWLGAEVSMMLAALEPELIVGDSVRWRVPVCLRTPDSGQAGIVGQVIVDVQTGEFSQTPELAKLLLVEARKLAKSLPAFQLKELPIRFSAAAKQPTHPAGRPAGNPLQLIQR